MWFCYIFLFSLPLQYAHLTDFFFQCVDVIEGLWVRVIIFSICSQYQHHQESWLHARAGPNNRLKVIYRFLLRNALNIQRPEPNSMKIKTHTSLIFIPCARVQKFRFGVIVFGCWLWFLPNRIFLYEKKWILINLFHFDAPTTDICKCWMCYQSLGAFDSECG